MIKSSILRFGNIYYKSMLPCVFCSTLSRNKTTEVVNADEIRTITLCNPKTRNALSHNTMNEIITHLAINPGDTDVRCVVIQSEGPVFSSGHNLKEFDASKYGKDEQRKVFSACTRLMTQIVECPVPVIAIVTGLAAAAGCQLVAQCDIAICTPNSSFSTPGANFGLFCSTPGIALARSATRKVAMRMLLTGLPLTAEEAYHCGLVSKVVPTELLDKELKIITDAIKFKSQSVIALGKKFFYQQIEQDLFEAYRLGEEVMVNNLFIKDGQEGIRSFIEKRQAVWVHTAEKMS